MDIAKILRCRECGKEYPPAQLCACQNCFGPLDVIYDYDAIELTKKSFQNRPRSLWRYFELLPVFDRRHIIDLGAGFTPLRKAERLGKELGLRSLYIKDDTVNPTFSFKDRPASVAVSKTLEFGLKGVGCASTGNLAAAVAALAAKAGVPCYVFVPKGIEETKIVQIAAYGATILAVNGTYDEANRLAAQVAETHSLGFVNINIRPYYVEGSKTLAFEVCEQLEWRTPDHVIVPVGSGALLCAIARGFNEFRRIGLVGDTKTKVTAAQGEGCAPIVEAFRAGMDYVNPVEYPKTIAKSLAIGDPGDGFYALKKIRESAGYAEAVTDEEIASAIKLLARTEGVFAEPAGGVSVAVLKKLTESDAISPDEEVVCYVTGNGLKTPEALLGRLAKPVEVEPTIQSLAMIIGG